MQHHARYRTPPVAVFLPFSFIFFQPESFASTVETMTVVRAIGEGGGAIGSAP